MLLERLERIAVAEAAILDVIFGIVTDGRFASPAFSYMYLGNR